MSESVGDGGVQVVAAEAVPQSEGSWIGRGVALFTPVFAVASGWLAGLVAQVVPGAHLDESQVTAFMVAAMTAALGSGWKWLQGWQQHERLVAEGKAQPVKAVPVLRTATTSPEAGSESLP
ncbi:hypothetical protein [Spirillospora albida]|uniref:hypothetical protein n=1 Tax=Spirillospora albida TaxID=58123 RepID=UPI0012FC5217|nr:hypothetical protein [Spirillospora albida]